MHFLKKVQTFFVRFSHFLRAPGSLTLDQACSAGLSGTEFSGVFLPRLNFPF